MVTDMEQISIFELLTEQTKSDFPCDTCVYDIKGCCAYDEPLRRHCVEGDSYIERYDIAKDTHLNAWEKCESGKTELRGISLALVDTDTWSVPTNIDRVVKGIYDGEPAEIGLRYCVYGMDESDIWVPIMYRRY